MVEALISSSRYKLSSLSIDSRFADQNYAPDIADFAIRLPKPLKNIARIQLTNIELPPLEYTFTKLKGNCSLGSNTVPVTQIADGNYTVATLCTAVQGVLGPGFSCVEDPVTSLLTITGPTQFTLYFGAPDVNISSRNTYWGLGYMLGFRSKGGVATSTVGGVLVATAPPIVWGSAYYLLQLQCPDNLDTVTHRLANNTWCPAFAKIVLTRNSYRVEIDDTANLDRKDYTFLSPTNISKLRVRLLDPFGLPVRFPFAEWSMTLEVTEVVNVHMYDKLMQTYAS